MTIQDIKDRINIIEVVENYCTLTGRGDRLRAAKGENPVREDGSGDFDVWDSSQKFYDQGSHEGGSVIDFIEVVEKLDTHHACLFLVDRYLGGSNITTECRPPIIRKPQLPTELTYQRHQEITAEIEKFDRSNKQTFADAGYKQSALSIAPMWLYSEAEEVDRERFKEFTTYDEVLQEIVLKLYDSEDKLISYKHRYKMIEGERRKWCAAWRTHPNRQCMISLPRSGQCHYIFIVEGSRDFLTMVLLGLNVIAIPGTSYKKWTEHELSLLAGRKVVLIPDLDPKFGGLNCMRLLAEQITVVADSVKVFNVRQILSIKGIQCDDLELDLSDAVDLWTEGRDEFVSTLSYLTYKRSKK